MRSTTTSLLPSSTTHFLRHRRPISSSSSSSSSPSSSSPPSSSPLEDLLLVSSVSKLLSQSGTRNLDNQSIPITQSLVQQLLRRNSIWASTKIDFFKWASLRPHFKHSPCTYSLIFHAVCRAGCLNELRPLLNLMKNDGVVVDSSTFKRILDAFIRSGKFDLALEVVDDMEELGATLSPYMYDSVIIALIRKNQVGLALSMFYKLVDASKDDEFAVVIGPNAVACNELLVALRKADMRVEFKRVFEKLREKNVGLDRWGYNICIHGFGCWGELSSSLELYKEMKEKGSEFEPDLCTYNSLIHVLCAVGKVKEGLIVWEELKGSGHEPDAFSYRTIIQGCCKSYRIDDATRIFSEMQYNGFTPDTVVYNSILDGMLKARKLNEACRLFEKMVQDGIRASCWTYNILIDGLFRNGRAVAAYTLFCDLKKKGQFVDGVTYSIVILHLCRENHLGDAFELVEEMEARGFVVDLVTLTSFFVTLHKQGRWDWSEKWSKKWFEKLMKHVRDGSLLLNVLQWQEKTEALMRGPQDKKKDLMPMFPSKGDFREILNSMTSNNPEPIADLQGMEPQSDDNQSISSDSWSSSPFMDRLVNEVESNNQSFSVSRAKGNLSWACKLFEIFTENGISPVSYTYNSMMTSFVKKGYLKEAWSVLHEMSEKLCPTDIATYNVIIQGLSKMGKADMASAVLDQLMKRGGYLDIVMYNTLINALGKAGRMDEAVKMFEQMKTVGINPDIVTFNTLIEVHCKAGKVEEACKFLKMMLAAGCSPYHVRDSTLDYLEKEMEKLRYQKASIRFTRKDDTKSTT
ncbi:hypothetical protein Syun_020039 [Stephania yunnanensis]|uniref:Pentatricopeptide repeat-containing protein n=1 Tax=Stephania yunnanensis TaxID=152371 RepID=A0AAP0NWD9_9MAGN